jgi:cytochrome oxidase Cu insertion factor (SCO1/SenC/PrrC family)
MNAGISNTRTPFAGIRNARAPFASVRNARTPFALLSCWLVITTAWWALALAPVADPPAWLLAARDVCFGSTASGLPDTYGWLLLAAAPATMLVAIFVTWLDELRAGFASLRQRASGRAAIAAVALFLVAGTAAAALRISDGLAIDNASFDPAEAGALPDHYPRLDLVVPTLALVDHESRPFTNENLRGRVTLFTFAFAHCRTVCPAIMQTLRTVASRLGDDAPEIVVLTLDPWRDTPSRLPQMHDEWDMPRRVRVLSGEVDDVTAALDGFHVPWQRDEATGDVVHPALVYAVDPQGRIAYGFTNPSSDWLTDAVARLAQHANPAPGQ